MITLFVRQGGQPEAEVKVNGDAAGIGRAPGSEIQLTQKYVSKRHLRVLKGIVIVDMGSSNGTFLDGKRIKDPVLYTGGELRIGDGDVFVRVRLDEPEVKLEASTSIAAPDSGLLRRDAEIHRELRSEKERLAPQLEAARKRIAELEAERERVSASSGARFTPQLEAARKRIAELEAERDQVSASASARLAPQLEAARQRIAALEAQRDQAAQPAGPSAAQLEAQASLARAQEELETLRARVAELQAAQEARPAAPVSPAAELFLRLQSENSTLKRKLAEIQAKLGTSSPAPVPVPVPTGETNSTRLKIEIAELRAQNAAFRTSGGAGAGRAPTSNVRALLARLAKDDVDRQEPLLTASVEEFLVVEQFRLVRNVERIVTRMAGDVIQLFDGKTMLPDLQGGERLTNLRQMITHLCESPEDSDARAKLLEYSALLSRWLVASLGAPRKAATSFAHKLKSDLTEGALTAQTPIPTFRRLSGQADAELWRRVGVYLRELTPDMIEDRLEKLSRAAALELVGQDSTPSAP
ncbi:MAG TPA: FHA domain-containing protein [Planctomycetota bacterium]|nr:FHA domain-containing protein [Planctomycetota bacterium]